MKSRKSIIFQKIFMILFVIGVLQTKTNISAAEVVKETGKTIRVGWFPIPEIQEKNNGVFSGYSYEYLMEIANYTGWKYEFVEEDFTTCSKMLEEGKIDILGALFYSDEKKYDFLENEYGHSYTTLFTTQNSDIQAYDYETFNDINIGFVIDAGTNKNSMKKFAYNNGFSYNEVLFKSEEELKKAVLEEKIDAGVLGVYTKSQDTKILAEFEPMPFYFAVRKNSGDIFVNLNRAHSRIEMDNPYLKIELYKKYFGTEQNVRLSKSEEKIVASSENEPIKVGIVDNVAPLCYWNSEKNIYEGICLDILNIISQKTGLKFEYVSVDMSRSETAGTVRKDTPQLLMGIIKTDNVNDERTLKVSNEVISDELIMVGCRGKDITQDGSDKVIAVMDGFVKAQVYVKKQFPEHKIIEYSTLKECMDAVASGKADATIHMQSCINYLLQNPHYEELEIIPTFSSDVEFCIASLIDEDGTLIRIVNKGLGLITENESRDMIMNYTIMNPYRLTVGDMFFKYRAPIIIISMLVFTIIAVLAILMTVKKRSQKKLQTAYEQEKAALSIAERASEAKGNFMSRMSHEIRTPLNAVIGYNTIAQNEMSNVTNEVERRQAEMKVMDCLTKSGIASKHLLTIINDVLDMSAIESGKIKVAHDRFDFKSLISSLTILFFSQAKAKGVEFEVFFDTLTEEWFVGDQMRINQILTNLLSNAVKFTLEGGNVKLHINQTKIEEETTQIHFEVSDTGIGMSKEYIERIWKPFEQEDSSISRRFGGTGLGLSITKNLVDLMGGQINVESKEGVGTKFEIDLTFQRTNQPKASKLYNFSTINALVVDDDESTCDYIKLLFDWCGAKCRTVTSGKVALDEFSVAIEKGYSYTVCLVDWRMPQMDGIETVKKIRSIAGEEVPIIVITAYDFTDIADEAREAGVDMFITKPLFQSSLFDLLVNISGDTGISEDINKTKEKLRKNSEFNFVDTHVLLAEDNEMNMEIAKKILESAGLHVDGVLNGKEAVAKFESSKEGTYDVILMDVQMPEMDGHEATRKIRELTHPDAKTIPIIAMTADAFSENVSESLASGMNDHISKPIDVNILFETLKKYI